MAHQTDEYCPVDAIEMTPWGDLYSGIDPYSLSDWYRYLNCGYLVPAVGGTDKMSADTAVGTVRTYARIPEGEPFTYGAWMDAVRRAETFVSYGPLLEFSVGWKPMGSRIELAGDGGTVDVTWQAASVTVPMPFQVATASTAPSPSSTISSARIVDSQADVNPDEYAVQATRFTLVALLHGRDHPDEAWEGGGYTNPTWRSCCR